MSLSEDLQYPACGCEGNRNGLFTERVKEPADDFICLHCGARWSA